MNESHQTALSTWLLAMADDQLILAHRNSEWIGHGPILEEDIALANIAQDELGHARLLYELYAALTGDDPDKLVFFRETAVYRSTQFVEYPKGDWAFTMLRQYLFDAAEMVLLTQLVDSTYQPLAQAAAKMRNEELYHYRHSSAWLKRLGLGTAESNQRTQTALDTLWPLAQQLFVPLPAAEFLTTDGVIPPATVWQEAWEQVVRPFLHNCDLAIPTAAAPPTADRAIHSPYLAPLLAEMQEVARFDPEATW
ncbi:MAG: phenylacetate-CoA oxygenase subunit PaaC [Ardenticatenaceae bacterium]|nr:phenylacetate-CoA oxygenase subunit PaaC [Ardenticatenaceae bacterium]